jgi:curved DNA-binding protein CbpA
VEDLYKKLQVDPQAESEVIRAAYHALARKYHPDAGGSGQRMVEFNAAWAVLGNPSLRAAYDSERSRPSTPPATAVGAQTPGRKGDARGDLPPRGAHDTSSVLDFGRYAGWSIAQVVRIDPDYLEWLVRTPIGRRLTAEVKTLLEQRAASSNLGGAGFTGAGMGGPRPVTGRLASAGRGWFGRARHDRQAEAR